MLHPKCELELITLCSVHANLYAQGWQ